MLNLFQHLLRAGSFHDLMELENIIHVGQSLTNYVQILF